MLSVLLISVLPMAAGQQQSVFHQAPKLPYAWTHSNDIVRDAEDLNVRFSLKEQNLEKVHIVARQVSDPQHNAYGQYLSASEVRSLTQPNAEDIAMLEKWLGALGLSFVRRGSNRFEVNLTVQMATRLLNTTFSRAINAATKQQVLLASGFWLPAEVDAVVAAVYGMHGLPLPPLSPLSVSPEKPLNVTPAILLKTYNVTGVVPSGSLKNRQAVAEFQGQQENSTDLKTFFTKYVPASKASSIHKFVGDDGEGDAQVEASLDVDYLMGVAPGVLTEFWYYKNADFCGALVRWTDSLLDSDDPPLVTSVSYGWQGDLSEIQCDQGQVDDVDANFVKLAARGITIIISSGDSGSAFKGQTQTCVGPGDPGRLEDTAVHEGIVLYSGHASYANDCCHSMDSQQFNGNWSYVPLNVSSPYSGGNCTYYKSVLSTKKQPGATTGPGPVAHLTPSWPGSSPWVTAVGATRFVDNHIGSAEMATDQFGSGGGFSKMFQAFGDQVAAVQHYLKTVPGSKLPPSGTFPPGGRATPDVAALGEGFQVVVNGEVRPVGGTSASAPTFAGFVSLLNEERLKAGKPAMGYLNPFLYQNAAAFRDVTIGTNAIGRQTGPLRYGYPCAPGWDPATGLGTPNFEKLLSAAMSAVGVREGDQVIV